MKPKLRFGVTKPGEHLGKHKVLYSILTFMDKQGFEFSCTNYYPWELSPYYLEMQLRDCFKKYSKYKGE